MTYSRSQLRTYVMALSSKLNFNFIRNKPGNAKLDAKESSELLAARSTARSRLPSSGPA